MALYEAFNKKTWLGLLSPFRYPTCVMNTQETPPPIPFIRELCKHKTPDEIVEAEENFRDFVRFVERLYDKMKAKERLMPPPSKGGD